MIQDGRDAFWSRRRYRDNPYSGKEARWWSFGFGLGASEEVNEMFKNPTEFFAKREASSPVSAGRKPTQLSLF